MTFSSFSKVLSSLENTSSRIEITKILSKLFIDLGVDEVRNASYLLTGSLAPSFNGIVFNVAGKMMERAISIAFNTPIEEISSLMKKVGDLGEVTEKLSKAGTHTNPSINAVFDSLVEISKESGDGSQERRTTLISNLLKSVDPLSAKFVTRIILGKIRLGFSEKTIIDALSWMEDSSKSNSKSILRSFEVVPDIGLISENVKKLGIEKATQKNSPIVGIPVSPMLCQRLKTTKEMIDKMKEVSVEPKFDGLRVLIHFSKKKKILRAFTRNLNEITEMFPELNQIEKHLNASEVILDSEAVGMDPELLKMADFQTTMTRRRKHDIGDQRDKVPLRFQVFDVLYVDGKNLMEDTYLDRRKELKRLIRNGNLLNVDENIITNDPLKIVELHKKFRSGGLEGIIAKRVDSKYIPGRVGWNWVKMKETEEQTGKLSDTVDAIIMGFSYGKGKRASFGVGQFLAGVIDNEQIVTVTKVGTGLTDDQFKELSTLLGPLKESTMPKEYVVSKALNPDVWVRPKIVVELAADDITISPNHTAKYALRFPRLVKLRRDKSINEATTVSEIKKLFKLQK